MRLSRVLKRALHELASWLLAIAIGIAAVVHIEELRAAVSGWLGRAAPQGPAVVTVRPEKAAQAQVEIRAGSHGHFLATAHLNGRPVQVLIDTGASFVALSYEDAQRAGVHVRPDDFTQRVATANGTARIAPVVLDTIGIGSIVMRDVPAAVSEPGRLGTTLLGMTFLGRLSRAELRNGILILQE